MQERFGFASSRHLACLCPNDHAKSYFQDVIGILDKLYGTVHEVYSYLASFMAFPQPLVPTWLRACCGIAEEWQEQLLEQVLEIIDRFIPTGVGYQDMATRPPMSVFPYAYLDRDVPIPEQIRFKTGNMREYDTRKVLQAISSGAFGVICEFVIQFLFSVYFFFFRPLSS